MVSFTEGGTSFYRAWTGGEAVSEGYFNPIDFEEE
jgi:hypothetical protein